MATLQEVESTQQSSAGLAKMARSLGYDSLEEYFDDNPGAVAAVVEFVLDQAVDREGELLQDEDEDTDSKFGLASLVPGTRIPS